MMRLAVYVPSRDFQLYVQAWRHLETWYLTFQDLAALGWSHLTSARLRSDRNSVASDRVGIMVSLTFMGQGHPATRTGER
jgi:hypothetical protein